MVNDPTNYNPNDAIFGSHTQKTTHRALLPHTRIPQSHHTNVNGNGTYASLAPTTDHIYRTPGRSKYGVTFIRADLEIKSNLMSAAAGIREVDDEGVA